MNYLSSAPLIFTESGSFFSFRTVMESISYGAKIIFSRLHRKSQIKRKMLTVRNMQIALIKRKSQNYHQKHNHEKGQNILQ